MIGGLLLLATLALAADLEPGGAAGARAPQFEAVDHEQRTVTLAQELERGPVVLVFYRGFW